MKGLLLLSVAALALLTAATASAGASELKATTFGTCLTQLNYDRNGVVNRSTVTCTATGSCSCDGLTKVSYQTITISAGNGASGLEHGTIALSGAGGSLALALRGKMTALGASTGTWTMGVAHGSVASDPLARAGTYQSTWTVSDPVTGTMTAKVRVALTMSCWSCAAPAR